LAAFVILDGAHMTAARRMKRTRKLALTSLMAAGGVSLTACDGGAGDIVRVEGPEPAIDAYAYQTMPECEKKDDVPDSACATAAWQAVEDDRRTASWTDQASCEGVYGRGQCDPHAQPGGSSLWGPYVSGFLVGRMSDGAWGGRGLYRDWRDGGFYTAGGGRVWTNYATGRIRIATRSLGAPDVIRPPEKILTGCPVISRRGFGGRVSARYCSGGSWGA